MLDLIESNNIRIWVEHQAHTSCKLLISTLSEKGNYLLHTEVLYIAHGRSLNIISYDIKTRNLVDTNTNIVTSETLGSSTDLLSISSSVVVSMLCASSTANLLRSELLIGLNSVLKTFTSYSSNAMGFLLSAVSELFFSSLSLLASTDFSASKPSLVHPLTIVFVGQFHWWVGQRA